MKICKTKRFYMFKLFFPNKLKFAMVSLLSFILLQGYCWADNAQAPGKKRASKADLIKAQTVTAHDGLDNNIEIAVPPKVKVGKAYATHDFGEVKEGTRPGHIFEFKNTTNKKIKLLNARVPCGCASIKITNKELKPGESTSFNVILDTLKHQGPISKSFYLLTDSKDKPLIKYEMKAVIKAKPAPICYAQRQIKLPPIKPGETKEITFPIENRGLKELVVQYRFPSRAIKVITKAPFIIAPAKKRDFIFQITAGNKPHPIKDKLILVTNDRRREIYPIIITGQINE